MKKKIKRLGIKFGDNDFENTFIPITKLFLDVYNFNATFDIPRDIEEFREEITNIINDISKSFYRLYQISLVYNDYEIDLTTEARYEHILINKERVFINEEVSDYVINQTEFHNHDFFAVDFESNVTYVV